MDIKVPYDELSLKIALMGASNKLEKEGLQEQLLSKLSKFTVNTMADYNIKVAEFHGISLADLINSPNYETLKSEYAKNGIDFILNVYKDAGFEDKEAWALVCVGLGQLII